jgi:hypothetical protein
VALGGPTGGWEVSWMATWREYDWVLALSGAD